LCLLSQAGTRSRPRSFAPPLRFRAAFEKFASEKNWKIGLKRKKKKKEEEKEKTNPPSPSLTRIFNRSRAGIRAKLCDQVILNRRRVIKITRSDRSGSSALNT